MEWCIGNWPGGVFVSHGSLGEDVFSKVRRVTASSLELLSCESADVSCWDTRVGVCVSAACNSTALSAASQLPQNHLSQRLRGCAGLTTRFASVAPQLLKIKA